MATLHPKVDEYLAIGCGRCPLVNTPDCKVHQWVPILEALRGILLDCGLTEEHKWSAPCYTADGKNICVLGAFKDDCRLGFFKGALLEDPQGLLDAPGPNSRSARQLRFTAVEEVAELERDIRAFIRQAIALEKAGKQVPKSDALPPQPVELTQRFAQDAVLKAAFLRLTPGRQRGYLLHFAAAKQSATRTARIDKYTPSILAGKGLHDR